jgi:hypothetical protein
MDVWMNPLTQGLAGNNNLAAMAAADKTTMTATATTKTQSPDRGRVVLTKQVEAITGRKNKLEEFDITRGSVFAVFTELDSSKEGRITKSMVAEAGYRIGMRREKIDEFYRLLDKEGRGFLSLHEWGAREMEEQVKAFSKLYLQVTRGPTGKLKEEPIRDLHSALAYAMGKLAIRETGRISRISHEKVLEAFTFIDSNHSSTIDEQELADAFLAMGVQVTDEVITKAMRSFDKDNSGTIDYYEFLSVLFPGLASAARDARQDFA